LGFDFEAERSAKTWERAGIFFKKVKWAFVFSFTMCFSFASYTDFMKP